MERERLGTIARFIGQSQGRQFGEDDLTIWFDAIGNLDGDLAFAAAKALVRETSDFITPARVRQRYGAMATARLEAAGAPAAPDGMSEPDYRSWLRAYRSAVIAGDTADDARHLAAKAIGRHIDDAAAEVSVPTFELPSVTSDGGAVEGTVVHHRGDS